MNVKRILDIVGASAGLVLLSPLFIIFIILIWLQDYHSPFYIAPRAGKNGKKFGMVKLRSMIVNAVAVGGSSTSNNDKRVTWVGKIIRRWKLDEFSQLWNVLKGDMSLVGPRPQVCYDVEYLYTQEEKKLLTVRPGITDFSSIVFSDEGAILSKHNDPDLAYNQLIRPWKSRLGLIYVQYHNIVIDIQLIVLTFIAIISKKRTLKGVVNILKSLKVDPKIIEVASRNRELVPYPPPGTDRIPQPGDKLTP